MSDRWVFLAAFLTSTFIVASAFAKPQFFFFELVKSAIFITICVMVFLGENRYSYMLGIAFPLLWFLVDILVGGLVSEFQVLFAYLAGRGVGPLGSPLDGFSRLGGIFLFIVSLAAWRKEADEPFWGHTFWVSLTVSLIYVTAVALWSLRLFPLAG